MGIDLYARWDGIAEDEKQAQYTGFADAGEAGYIREAYHGGPYATQVLIPEAFDDAAFNQSEADDAPSGALIVRSETDPPSDFEGQPRVLLADFVARKAAAMQAARDRGEKVYHGDHEYGDAHAKEVERFIDLVDAKVSEGATLRVYASY